MQGSMHGTSSHFFHWTSTPDSPKSFFLHTGLPQCFIYHRASIYSANKHPSFCTVKLKHHREGTSSKTHREGSRILRWVVTGKQPQCFEEILMLQLSLVIIREFRKNMTIMWNQVLWIGLNPHPHSHVVKTLMPSPAVNQLSICTGIQRGCSNYCFFLLVCEFLFKSTKR